MADLETNKPFTTKRLNTTIAGNEKKEKPSMQPAARSNRSVYWQPPMEDTPTTKRKNIYYWGPEAPEPEQVEYIVPYQPRKREPEYKSTGKFLTNSRCFSFIIIFNNLFLLWS